MTPDALNAIPSLLRRYHRDAMAYAGSPAATARGGLILLCGYMMAGAVAWMAHGAIPVSLSSVEEARSLGIHSLTIDADYPKSWEFAVYVVSELCLIGITIAFWWGWSAWCGRAITNVSRGDADRNEPPTRVRERRGNRIIDWVLIPILIAYSQFDIDRFAPGYWGYWPLFSEEGMLLAAGDRLLHGGVLYRDEFALYGPLMFYPVAWLLRMVDSVFTLRIYAFVLDCIGLLLLYRALLVFFRRRGWAALGLGFFLLNFSLAGFAGGSVFRAGIHASVFRFSIGLAWLLFYLRDPEGPKRRDLVLTGAALGVALTFSHEIGVVSSVSFLILLLTGRMWGIRTPGIGRQLIYSALGLGAVVVPWISFFASRGALQAAITNMFLYPRYIGLGYAGIRFPSVDDLWIALTHSFRNPPIGALTTLKGYWIPWMISVGAIALGIRLLQGRLDRDDRILLGLVLLAGMLFKLGLGRSDLVHFQAALVPAVTIGLMLARRFTAGVMIRRIPICSWSFFSGIVASLLCLVALQPPRPVLKAFVYGNLSPLDHKLKSQRDEEQWSPLMNIPRARGVLVPTVIAAEIEDVVRYIRNHTRPSDPIVAFPNDAAYYYYAERPNPTRFSVAYLAVTRKDRQEMIASMEEKRPPYVILSFGWRPDNITESVQVPELVGYIKRMYVPERQFGGTVILKRRDAH